MRSPVFDGHNDTLLNLLVRERGQGRDFFTRSDIGHLDLPRARKGYMVGGFFSLFTPAEYPPANEEDDLTITDNGYWMKLAPPERPEHAQTMTAGMLTLAKMLITRSRGRVSIATDVDTLRHCIDEDVFAMVLHMEGAEAIEPDLSNFDSYLSAGIRSVGLVWSRPNAFGHGVPYQFPYSPDTGEGVTDPGRDLIRACNQKHVMIDVSHLNERGFWDVAELSTHPLVATHSNVHAICPVTRNLTDRQLDAIGESDGVVGIAFDVSMIRSDGALENDTPLSMLVDHIDHVATRIGIDHVALGSDFDGAVMPSKLSDASQFSNLISALVARGYDQQSVDRITHENWIRVLTETWA